MYTAREGLALSPKGTSKSCLCPHGTEYDEYDFPTHIWTWYWYERRLKLITDNSCRVFNFRFELHWLFDSQILIGFCHCANESGRLWRINAIMWMSRSRFWPILPLGRIIHEVFQTARETFSAFAKGVKYVQQKLSKNMAKARLGRNQNRVVQTKQLRTSSQNKNVLACAGMLWLVTQYKMIFIIVIWVFVMIIFHNPDNREI